MDSTKKIQKISLVDEANQIKQLRKDLHQDQDFQNQQNEDNKIYEAMKGSALMTVWGKTQGIDYEKSVSSGWRPSKQSRYMSEFERQNVLNKYHILIEGENQPPPIKTFQEMRLPQPFIEYLEQKNISKPTPIQIQGLPSVLSGRDFIGIAFTGSGKSMCFIIPGIIKAIEEEQKMPIIRGEGPFVLILVPSRELALQTFDILQSFTKHLYKRGYPLIKSAVFIGGMDQKEQLDSVKNGIHIIVATPGRLADFLNRNKINLNLCSYLALDEADRLLDMAFEVEIRTILENFKGQRQTLLFSATMPKKIQEFAKNTLVKPLLVNVGRAGAANLDVIQEVEYVKVDDRLPYLLECLQKTSPPVLIFCENKNDVDDIHEYLMLKGVNTTGLHGGKTQDERNDAVTKFKNYKKDVLVATDVAAKGLDFPDIKHVINYDMPKDIESYVHRIGRTGRRGKTGYSTTFINKTQEQNILLDLKQLLIEAKQNIPQFLKMLRSNEDIKGECGFCGGLGHRISNCQKMEQQQMKAFAANCGTSKDVLAAGAGSDL